MKLLSPQLEKLAAVLKRMDTELYSPTVRVDLEQIEEGLEICQHEKTGLIEFKSLSGKRVAIST